MQLNSPLSDAKADRLIAVLELAPASEVVDFGCGDGEFLSRLHAATGASCLGLDLDPGLIAAATARAERLPGAQIEFRAADVASAPINEESPGPGNLHGCLPCLL